MKYIPLQGQPWKIDEIYTPYRENPGNYMKYLPLQETTL